MNHTAGGATPPTNVSKQGQETREKKAARAITLRLVLGVVISIVAFAVFAWVWDQVKDKDRDTTAFDRSLLWWMYHHRVPWLLPVVKGLAFVGSPPVIVSIAVVAVIVGLLWRKVRGAAWTLPIGVIGAGVLIQAIKVTVGRPRPSFFTPLLHETGKSFPSGHSLIAVVVYGLLGYFAMHLFKARWARILVGCLTVLIVLSIGISRVYVGVHYPTDVLAGWTCGIPWLITCLAIHEHLTRRFAETGEPVLHNPPSLDKAAAAVAHKTATPQT